MMTSNVLDWVGEKHTVQHWLERTAWQNLKNTGYGIKDDAAPPNHNLWEDALLRQVYIIDLAMFISTEKVSVDCVSASVRMAPDEKSMVYLATQTLDESRHFEVFCKRLGDIDLSDDQRSKAVNQYTTPELRKFHDLLYEQIDKKDFLGETITHNIILEGMAYPIYRYETKYWSRLDPGLSQLITGAFQDEVQHVGFGEAMVKSLIQGNPTARNKAQRLMKDSNILMKEVFRSMIAHYIGLYQEAANEYMDLMGDVEIFPGRHMKNVTEEDQMKILLDEIDKEYERRAVRIGIF